LKRKQKNEERFHNMQSNHESSIGQKTGLKEEFSLDPRGVTLNSDDACNFKDMVCPHSTYGTQHT